MRACTILECPIEIHPMFRRIFTYIHTYVRLTYVFSAFKKCGTVFECSELSRRNANTRRCIVASIMYILMFTRWNPHWPSKLSTVRHELFLAPPFDKISYVDKRTKFSSQISRFYYSVELLPKSIYGICPTYCRCPYNRHLNSFYLIANVSTKNLD